MKTVVFVMSQTIL